MATGWQNNARGQYDPYGATAAGAAKATGAGPAQPTPGTAPQSGGWRAKTPFGKTLPSAGGGAPPLPGGQAMNPEGASQPSAYGSQSGPGLLESWFNQRAQGTDPAFEYASKRGMQSLGNQYAAAGSFNSGAARQGESDLQANLIAQRMGQLDNLAGGASAEHMGRLGMMFGQGLGLAGGQAGLSSAYDLGAAGNMQAANNQQAMLAMNKAGVDSQAFNSALNTGLNVYGLSKVGGGNNPYGGGAGGGAPKLF